MSNPPPPIPDTQYRISLDNIQIKDNNYIHLPNESNIPGLIHLTSLNLSVKTSETAIFILEIYSTVDGYTTRTPIAHSQTLSYGGYNIYVYNARDLDIYCRTYSPNQMKNDFCLIFSLLSHSPIKPTFAVSGCVNGTLTYKPIYFSNLNRRLG